MKCNYCGNKIYFRDKHTILTGVNKEDKLFKEDAYSKECMVCDNLVFARITPLVEVGEYD